MKNKLIRILSLSFVLVFSLFITASAEKFSPAMSVLSSKLSIDFSSLAGKEVKFSEETIKKRLGSDYVTEIRILSLPEKDVGSLLFKGENVREGQSVKRNDFDKLSFMPSNDMEGTASFEILVSSHGVTYPVKCGIKLIKGLNFAPESGSDEITLSTFSFISYKGRLPGMDREGDAMTFEITSYPRFGTLELSNADDGSFSYTQTSSGSSDSFSYRIIDSCGNISEDIGVNIEIETPDSSVVYSDMKGRDGEYAATLLGSRGIYEGETICGMRLFSPDSTVSSFEFLLMASGAAGIEILKDAGQPVSEDYIRECCLAFLDGRSPELLSDADETVLSLTLTEKNAAAIINCIMTNDRNGNESHTIQPEKYSNNPLTKEKAAMLIVEFLIN